MNDRNDAEPALAQDRAAGAEVRPATTEDDPALGRLDELAWSPDVTPAPRRGPGRPFFDDRKRPEDVLVAESEGRVVGYVMIQQAIALPSHAHVLEVNGLAVEPSWAGRGIGRLLVESAKQEAARRGARKLSLRVLAPNAVARRLYASSGFVVEGRLVGEFVLDGRPVDDLLMACCLDASGMSAHGDTLGRT